MTIKEELLDKVIKFANTGSYLTSDEVKVFQKLDQKDQLAIVKSVVNPIATVQISSVIVDPEVQSEMLYNII